MAIKINTLCLQCLINKHLETARELDETKANAFAKELMEVLQNALENSSSAVAGAKINGL